MVLFLALASFGICVCDPPDSPSHFFHCYQALYELAVCSPSDQRHCMIAVYVSEDPCSPYLGQVTYLFLPIV